MSQNEISKILKTSRNTVRKIKIADDAILDRITPKSHKIKIDCDKSMRSI